VSDVRDKMKIETKYNIGQRVYLYLNLQPDVGIIRDIEIRDMGKEPRAYYKLEGFNPSFSEDDLWANPKEFYRDGTNEIDRRAEKDKEIFVEILRESDDYPFKTGEVSVKEKKDSLEERFDYIFNQGKDNRLYENCDPGFLATPGKLKAFIKEEIANTRKEIVEMVDGWLEYELHDFEGGCGQCGGKLMEIRGRYPNEPKRQVCPTCLMEIMENVRRNLIPPQASQLKAPNNDDV